MMADNKEATMVKGIWEAAEAKFKDLTGKSLQSGPIKTFDALRLEIEARSRPSSGDDESAVDGKWDKAKFKSAGLEVLKWVKILVGAAVQASAVLPIPSGPVANMCAKALIMALDVPQAIRDLNDAISDVFTRVASVLSQFSIYERLEEIDIVLARQIHLVMVSFVTICAHVVNYQQGSRWDRFKQSVDTTSPNALESVSWFENSANSQSSKAKKAILDDDSGLKAELSNFERLVQQQRDVEGTLLLATVITNHKDICQVLEQNADRNADIQVKVNRLDQDAADRREEKDRTKKLTKIRDALNVPPHVRLETNTTETCTKIHSKCINGTGAWVWDHPSYQEWTSKSQKGRNSLLLLSGDSSSGKTSIAAMIIKKLEDQQRTRIYVAHYFFPPSTKKSDDDKYPVHSALKYMAFQIARVDTTVSNTLYKACDNPERGVDFRALTDLMELWDQLRIGAPGLAATYYLVFDGLEHLKDKHAEVLVEFALRLKPASEQAGSRVRVLLSGAERVFKDHADVETALRIDVSRYTIPDMEAFIDNELNTRGMLQHAKPGSKQGQARDLIREQLPQSVNGSYFLLQHSLDKIFGRLDSGADLTELQGILKTSMSSHEAAIQTLQTLQRSLGPDETKDLNELLKWIMFGAEAMTLDQLEAAMYLQSGNESLVTLKYIIQKKFSAVLKLEDDFFMVQDDVRDTLQRRKDNRHKFSASQEGPTISMSITINNVDQELCQHFLWDLAQKSIRDKFRFDFDGAANHLLSSQAAIEVDEFEAHHSIVKQAFDYLAHDPRDETKPIGKYLVPWLPWHLRKLRTLEMEDEGELSPVEKRKIADGLYNIFQSDLILERHKDSFEGRWMHWYHDEMLEFNEWFMDSAVVRRLDKHWLREIRSAPNPTRGYLRPLVQSVLKQLLLERERPWGALSAYRWIEQFVLLVSLVILRRRHRLDAKPDDKGDDESVSSDGAERVDISWRRQVSQWCQNYLGLQDAQLDSFWYERLGEAAAAMLPHGDTSEAIQEFYQTAVKLSDPSWRSYKGLGEEEFRQDRVQDALAHVGKALELADEAMSAETSRPAATPADIVRLHLQLGDYCFATDAIDKATDHYSSARDTCPSEETVLARKADAWYLRAQLRTLDADIPAMQQLLRQSL
ncbi:hypothetical protein PG993_008687, partial [Apiospora rasikravindrae]